MAEGDRQVALCAVLRRVGKSVFMRCGQCGRGVSGGEEVVWEGEGVQVLLMSDEEEERIQDNNVVANKEERKLFIKEDGAARGGNVEEESDYRRSTVRVGELCTVAIDTLLMDTCGTNGECIECRREGVQVLKVCA